MQSGEGRELTDERPRIVNAQHLPAPEERGGPATETREPADRGGAAISRAYIEARPRRGWIGRDASPRDAGTNSASSAKR